MRGTTLHYTQFIPNADLRLSLLRSKKGLTGDDHPSWPVLLFTIQQLSETSSRSILSCSLPFLPVTPAASETYHPWDSRVSWSVFCT